MRQNWVTLIAAFLLLSPIILGLMRGLTTQLEITQYKIRSFVHSIQWLLAYLAAPFVLRNVIIQNPWHISLFDRLTREIENSLIVWVITIPIIAMVLFYLLNMVLNPFMDLLANILHRTQLWTRNLTPTISRISAAILATPIGLVQMLIFVLIVHLTLTIGQFPSLSSQAHHSSLYQWANHKVINPLLQNTLPKHSTEFKLQSQEQLL